MNRSLVIGIAGGSGSGKSTVLKRLVRALGSDSIAVLDHDAYYRDLGHLPMSERVAFNFDHPNALDSALLCQHIDELLAGRPIEKPIYDFTTHSRSGAYARIEPRRIIIVEGILVLAESELVARMDAKIFVDADSDVRLMRRIHRDMSERGRSIDSIMEQYERTVRPMYLEFVEPSKRLADIIIPRGGHNRVAIDIVVAHLRSLLEND